jgi:hypothetical protein
VFYLASTAKQLLPMARADFYGLACFAWMNRSGRPFQSGLADVVQAGELFWLNEILGLATFPIDLSGISGPGSALIFGWNFPGTRHQVMTSNWNAKTNYNLQEIIKNNR